MSLADDKIKRDVETTLAGYEKNLAGKGLPMKFSVDWNSYGGTITKETAERAMWVGREFAEKFGNFLLNYDNADYKAIIDAIKTKFNTLKVAHASTGSGYAYTMDIKSNTCNVSADMTKFIWSSSSRDDQPSIKSYLENIL